jgi:hypothetical protein
MAAQQVTDAFISPNDIRNFLFVNHHDLQEDDHIKQLRLNMLGETIKTDGSNNEGGVSRDSNHNISFNQSFGQ